MYTYKDLPDLSKFDKFEHNKWEDVCNHVFIRYINKGNIEDYGNDIVYDTMMDLAVVVSVQECHGYETYSHLVTNADIQKWHTNADEVFDKAKENMECDRRKRVLSLSESLMQFNPYYPIAVLPPVPYVMVTGSNDVQPGVIYERDEDTECENVIVVTSSKESFGASYAFIPSTLSEIYERFKYDNFYMIPMSIHRMMCVRQSYLTKKGTKPTTHVEDELLDLIYRFNDSSKTDYKSVLSYRIYLFSGDDGGKLISIKQY